MEKACKPQMPISEMGMQIILDSLLHQLPQGEL